MFMVNNKISAVQFEVETVKNTTTTVQEQVQVLKEKNKVLEEEVSILRNGLANLHVLHGHKHSEK